MDLNIKNNHKKGKKDKKMASSSSEKQTSVLDTEDYRDSEFIRKIARIVFSEEFFEDCEFHQGVMYDACFYSATSNRKNLITAIADYETNNQTTEEHDEKIKEIIFIWNIILWLLKDPKYGKQVYVNPIRSHIICEMSGYEFQQQDHYAYREDDIMIGIHQQFKAAILIFGDQYSMMFRQHGKLFTKDQQTIIDQFPHIDVISLSRQILELWYNPIFRAEFINKWEQFLQLLIPSSFQPKPIELGIDWKIKNTLETKIPIDKSIGIETLVE